ncbi:outer membrane beta-barrel protein [uncultured Roseovarius sp.]|uniref:outer membrane protein n=1 Tax=uncultured Roseovarius sp. TaxID=293344 RepID=UPI002627D6B7|nr:outer membrane beta-barrel protein [uncultured Roseovarius sp.]
MTAHPKHFCLAAFAIFVAVPVSAQQAWDGPYLGVHVGAVTSDLSNGIAATPGPSGTTSGMVGGFQLGYNWQSGSSVLGAEADVTLTDISDRFVGGAFDEDMMTSLRIRAGVTQGETLFFGSFGVAWTEQHTSLTGTGSSSDFEPGLMLGAGAERFLWNNIAGRVEAYYVDAPAETRNIGGTAAANGSENVIFRAGLSLHF